MLYLREGCCPTHGILQQRSSLTPTPRCRSIRACPVVLHHRVVIRHQAELDGHPAAPCPAWLQRPVLNHVSREKGARPTDRPEGPAKAHQCKRRKCHHLLLPKCRECYVSDEQFRLSATRPAIQQQLHTISLYLAHRPLGLFAKKAAARHHFKGLTFDASGRAFAGGP
jgi:hypothetical protein